MNRLLLSRLLRMFAWMACVSAVHAADAVRSPCTLRASDDGLKSDAPDAATITLTADKPAGLANWNVRWEQRRRLWVTIGVHNTGDHAQAFSADIAVDRQPGGGASNGQAAPHLDVPAGATVRQRLTIYLPDDAHTAGVRLRALAPGAGTSASASLAIECSQQRYDAGQMAAPAGALLDEALKVYLGQFADPIGVPRQALDAMRERASGAQDGFDVAWALRTLMYLLHDDRSSVRVAGEPAPAAPAPVGRPDEIAMDADGIALLRPGPVLTATPEQAQAAAAALHARIEAVAERRPRGWILDLRELDGGDPWPLLAALGSLLGGPNVGAFAQRESRQPWIVERGSVRLAGEPAFIDLHLPPEPPFTGPIAVLVGPRTAGAGEVLATAFEGRGRTRFFGQSTRGADPDALRETTLSDGNVLSVVTLRNVDRNGVVYRGPIEPDEAADDGGDERRAIPVASDWIIDQK